MEPPGGLRPGHKNFARREQVKIPIKNVKNKAEKSEIAGIIKELSNAKSNILFVTDRQADTSEMPLLKKAHDGVVAAINALTQLK